MSHYIDTEPCFCMATDSYMTLSGSTGLDFTMISGGGHLSTTYLHIIMAMWHIVF